MIFLVRSCFAIAIVAVLTSGAIGQNIFDDVDKDGPRFLGGFVIGNQFTVGTANVQIDALGVWDQADNGLAVSHDVGLWDATGAIVASATVPAGTAGLLDDSFRYVPLASVVTLLAGQQYRIAALFQSTSDPFNDPWDPDGDGNPANSPAIGNGIAVVAGSGIATVDGDYFAASATLVRPTNFGGGDRGRWGAANARVHVPEPTSLVLCVACGALASLQFRVPVYRS